MVNHVTPPLLSINSAGILTEEMPSGGTTGGAITAQFGIAYAGAELTAIPVVPYGTEGAGCALAATVATAAPASAPAAKAPTAGPGPKPRPGP